jgi:16S rRNA (cytosine967-C5)-methyltransferase
VSHPTSRQVAWQVLHEWFCHPRDRVEPAITQLTDKHRLAGPDRGLVVELVYGVIRRQLTLDVLLGSVVRQPLPAMELGLVALLRLGAYQQVFLPDMPAHAAVHETVNVARHVKKERWVSLTNAVLRNIASLIGGEYSGPVAADVIPICVEFVESPETTFPACRGIRLTKPLLPDPNEDSPAYLSKACSFPPRYVERRLKAVAWGEVLRECAWFNTPGRLCLRVNRLRTDRNSLIAELHEAGISSEPGALEESIRVSESTAVSQLPAMIEGRASVQDESAMWSARLLNPQPGERVWDVCAAPGGKTTHLAELAYDQAAIVATDVSPERLARVREACDRLRIRSVETRSIGKQGHDMPDGPFDAVLLDVPCSNTGVMGKRPEVRWRLKSNDFRELTALQSKLLVAAADRVRSGGRLVYSTCSIDPSENHEQVQSFLAAHLEWRLDRDMHHAPGIPCDGGYAALLVKV